MSDIPPNDTETQERWAINHFSNQYPTQFSRCQRLVLRPSDACYVFFAAWETLDASMRTVLDGSLFRVYEILSMVTGYVFFCWVHAKHRIVDSEWHAFFACPTCSGPRRRFRLALSDACRRADIVETPLAIFDEHQWRIPLSCDWYVWLFCAEKIIDLWTNWPASVWRCCLADSARSRS